MHDMPARLASFCVVYVHVCRFCFMYSYSDGAAWSLLLRCIICSNNTAVDLAHTPCYLDQSGLPIQLCCAYVDSVARDCSMLNHVLMTVMHAANVETDLAPSDEELNDSHLPQSFVPSTSPSMTEQEAVHHSVQQRQSSP